MLSVVHVVGARPNFMKAGPVIDALEGRVRQVLVHTGQHYDAAMSQVFFDELGLRPPDVNLGIGSGSHAQQTAALLTAIEATVLDTKPDCTVVYGDVNSTLAAALACAKLDIPVVHVEAGLRSFDDTMPEEINRRVTDVLSSLLLVHSAEAIDNLQREGRPDDAIHLVGNTMIDTLLRHRARFDAPTTLARIGAGDIDDRYGVVTLHRPANVDSDDAASRVAHAVNDVARQLPLLIPLHPRGRERLATAGLVDTPRTRLVEPLGYIDFMSLVSQATLVLTDSGGVQEETTVLDVPCLTMRDSTERPITITHGTNRLVTPEEVPTAARAVLDGTASFPSQRPPLWDGHAGPRCADLIVDSWP